MAAWLYTIAKAWDIVPYARARYAEYVGNEKAWAKDVEENGKTPAEIIEAWGWTPGETIMRTYTGLSFAFASVLNIIILRC